MFVLPLAVRGTGTGPRPPADDHGIVVTVDTSFSQTPPGDDARRGGA
ncbi:MAG: hypothetical protein ACTHPS_05420 [Streptosporangiaceae bacterium]